MMTLKFISLFFILTFIGCDIFNTRVPEPPSEQSSNYIQPTAPQIVITNFKNAIEDYNVDNYIKCFVDTSFSDKHFEFVHSLETGIDRSLFYGWNLESEHHYLINLGKPPYGIAGLILTNERSINVTSDSVIYNYDYSLTYPHGNPNFPTSFSGNLQFYLSVDRNRTNWSIYKWLDFKTGSAYTWSYLKAVFIGG
jgi:hypothetical protein